MSSLNRCTIIGRLGDDPTIRYTQSNKAVATLSIATSQKYKDKDGQMQEDTEWHRVTAWGRTAEICQQYLTKGSLVYIEGPIKTRKWQDKEGRDQYTTEITALQLTMLGGKGDGVQSRPTPPPAGDSAPQGQNKPLQSGADLNVMDTIDDDLPF